MLKSFEVSLVLSNFLLSHPYPVVRAKKLNTTGLLVTERSPECEECSKATSTFAMRKHSSLTSNLSSMPR